MNKNSELGACYYGYIFGYYSYSSFIVLLGYDL